MSIVNTDTEKYILVEGIKFYEDGDIANATLTRELLCQYTNPVCCDIGCDKGWWSRWVAHYCPTATIHCFEPNKKSYLYLQKEFQDRQKIQVYPYAISSNNGILNLTNDGPQSTSRILEYDSTYDVVECKRLDTLLGNEAHFTILKIDTEGHDVIILESLLPLLRESKIDHIISELTLYWDCEDGEELKDKIFPVFLELLDVMPHLYLLSRRQNYLIGPITEENIFLCFMTLYKSHLQTDILFSREIPKVNIKIITFNEYYKHLVSGSFDI